MSLDKEKYLDFVGYKHFENYEIYVHCFVRCLIVRVCYKKYNYLYLSGLEMLEYLAVLLY